MAVVFFPSKTNYTPSLLLGLKYFASKTPNGTKNHDRTAKSITNTPAPRKTGDRILDKVTGERLPIPLTKVDEEFPPAPTLDSWDFRKQQGARVYNIARSRIVQPRFVGYFCLSISAVFGIGFIEASYLCQDIPFLESLEAGKFCVFYGIEQIIPSCIWSSQEPALIAKAYMLSEDPYAHILREFQNSAKDAEMQLRVNTLAAVRSVFASFMMLAQLVNVLNNMARAGDVYKDLVYDGKEPLFSESRNVFFASAGKTVTLLLSLERYVTYSSLKIRR